MRTTIVGEDTVSKDLIERHYAGLHSLLQRKIKDTAVADEMLNEAVVTAISHLRVGRVSDPERLAGYVYRVAMNLYRNYRREFDNRAELRAGPDDLQQIPSHYVGEDALDSGMVARVRAIISSLPTARDREIVTRFYLNEEDKDTICHALQLSPLHFDRVIFRARQRMRGLLEAQGFSRTDFFSVLLACCL
jgi:RNA polymerase sigma-70 factor (ECF subfamily)